MTDDTSKDTPQRAYAKGYAAGQRKKQESARMNRIAAQRDAFKDRAFLAILPWVFQQNIWGVTSEGTHVPYRTVEERVRFAWFIAQSATVQRS